MDENNREDRSWGRSSKINRAKDSIVSTARIAIDADITLNDVQTLDGISLADRDIALVTGQSDPTENGLYRVISGDDWVRVGRLSGGMLVSITEGTAYAGTVWELIFTGAPDVDTDDLVFVEIAAQDSLWRKLSGFTATPLSAYQITIASIAGLAAGMPIRYTITATGDAVFYYGLIIDVSGTTIQINGPYLTSRTLKGLWVGSTVLVAPVDFVVPGKFAVSGGDILDSILHTSFYWPYGPAWLCYFKWELGTPGGGASRIDLKIDGSAVIGGGIIPGTSGLTVHVDTPIYFDQLIEITVTDTDPTDADLTAFLRFVSE